MGKSKVGSPWEAGVRAAVLHSQRAPVCVYRGRERSPRGGSCPGPHRVSLQALSALHMQTPVPREPESVCSGPGAPPAALGHSTHDATERPLQSASEESPCPCLPPFFPSAQTIFPNTVSAGKSFGPQRGSECETPMQRGQPRGRASGQGTLCQWGSIYRESCQSMNPAPVCVSGGWPSGRGSECARYPTASDAQALEPCASSGFILERPHWPGGSKS